MPWLKIALVMVTFQRGSALPCKGCDHCVGRWHHCPAELRGCSPHPDAAATAQLWVWKKSNCGSMTHVNMFDTTWIIKNNVDLDKPAWYISKMYYYMSELTALWTALWHIAWLHFRSRLSYPILLSLHNASFHVCTVQCNNEINKCILLSNISVFSLDYESTLTSRIPRRFDQRIFKLTFQTFKSTRSWYFYIYFNVIS